MKDKNQISYYDLNSSSFIAGTIHADMAEHYERFLENIPEGGLIVDAGCGSGRDAKRFLDMGYQVIAFDYSIKMVEHASALSGLTVRNWDFLDLKIKEKVDGIWACASLLHVDKPRQKEILKAYRDQLTDEGVFFMSFKFGEEDYAKNGRNFYCHTPDSLKKLIEEVGGYDILEVYVTEDVRKDRENEKWCSAVIRRSDL